MAGGPETKGQKMPTGFSGMDVMEALVGVVRGPWSWVRGNRVRLAVKGGKRDAGGSLQGDWKVFIFVLFCFARAETTSQCS